MKVSLNCLNEFVDIKDVPLKDLVHELTMRAFEVEDYEAFNDSIDERIVLGEILEITPHPNADKLQVTKTAIGLNADGTKNIQQIVCGAKNIAVGQKVPVATIGAKLKSVKGDFIEIKPSKIRDVESFGMLCGVEELGFSEDEVEKIKAKQGDGIYLFFDPNRADIENKALDLPLGTNVRKVLGIEEDTVLDIGARSNRGDALSVQGQAREISALLQRPLKQLTSKGIQAYASENADFIEPEITDTKDTLLFYTLNVSGLKVKDSPQWLKDRLNAMGMKSINNLVDISNYVQLTLGQPLHFYDKDKLKGSKLVSRRANSGESMKALDGETYELSEINLVIADESGPVAIAGVMGGFDSQITAATNNIVIESAVFYPATVRRSARAAGIDSEAKKRFERGVDKLNTLNAILMSLDLLSNLATDETNAEGSKLTILGNLAKAGDETLETKEVSLRLSQIKRFIGIDLSLIEVQKLLAPLGISYLSEIGEVSAISNGVESNQSITSELLYAFSVPSFRTKDIQREIDLIEEIARIYGYDNIPAQLPPMQASLEVKEDNIAKDGLENLLIAEGFNQVILSSLVSDTSVSESAIKMLNPLSKDYSVLRTSLLPSLLKAVSKNYANDRTTDIKLFEFGKTYSYKRDKNAEVGAPQPCHSNSKYDLSDTSEVEKVAIVMARLEKSWTDEQKPLHREKDFYEFKSIIERLYQNVSFTTLDAEPTIKKTALNSDTESFLTDLMHPGIAAKVIYQAKEIGYIAKIHPQKVDELELPEKLYFIELELPRKVKSKFGKIIKNPPVERDITVDAASVHTYAEIVNGIKKFKSKDLQDIKLLDLYQSSFTLRLRWHSEQEYSREQIDAEVVKLKEFLIKELSVAFRV
ncbi:MAG: phenylalanine--tRNA ligase subunit beta [Candidatus Melainabacteria bacterium]|nr:phenylalanine--tRNA ligase subunit beta [Candidatus Melainabacteria bacterium]